jgi:hypothetical protein
MLIGSAWAQRTITGTVIDATQGSLPGATVQVKGTNTGTTTDLEGKYSIVVPEGSEMLVFRFVGYTSQEETIGNRTSIDVTLAEASELTEVVVTAQNISREKASLAYSQQNLDGAAVSTVKETNFINSLSVRETSFLNSASFCSSFFICSSLNTSVLLASLLEIILIKSNNPMMAQTR